ncbi:MAG: hypothetical protein ACQEQ4_10460 [Fibrobacterota bacterium]
MAIVMILTTAAAVFITAFVASIQPAPPPHGLRALANLRSALLCAVFEPGEEFVFDAGFEQLQHEKKNMKEVDVDTLPGIITRGYSAKAASGRAQRTGRVSIGSTLTPHDTTLIVFSDQSYNFATPVSGITIQEDPDNLPADFPLRMREEDFKTAHRLLQDFFSDFSPDTPQPLTHISRQEDLREIPDSTPLSGFFIDGYGHTVSARERVFYIAGDLQATGSVTLEGGTFFVQGEVRINDRISLKDSKIYTAGRVFLADESSFSGLCVAGDNVEIFQNARFEDGILLSLAEPGENTAVTLHLRDYAEAAGTLAARGTLQTGPHTVSRGVIAALRVVHNGTHRGLIAAHTLGEKTDDSSQEEPLPMEGRIYPPQTTQEYLLPWFMGVPKILQWEEQ